MNETDDEFEFGGEDPLDRFIAEAFRYLPEPEPPDALRARLQERVAIRTAPLRRIVVEERKGCFYRRVAYEEGGLLTTDPPTTRRGQPDPIGVITRFYYIRETNR